MSGLRVGIDYRLDESGLGRYTSALLRHMIELAPEHTFYVFTRPDRPIPFCSNQVVHVKNSAPKYSLREQSLLPIAFMRRQLDVLHVPHFNVPVAYPGATVATIHDVTHADRHARPDISETKRALFRILLRRTVGHARRVVVSSQATHAALSDLIPGAAAKSRVIYPAFEAATFSHTDDEVLCRLGIAARPFWLAVGNFFPNKNLKRLVEAFCLARSEGLDGSLVLAGDAGGQGAGLLDHARVLGFADDVLVPGRVSDAELSSLYNHARGLAFVSLAEGFGLPCLEAFAHDLPLVSSSTGSLAEAAGAGGYAVDPLSVRSIADGLKAVSSDPALRAHLRHQGARRLEAFSWQATAAATLAVYDEAIGGSR